MFYRLLSMVILGFIWMRTVVRIYDLPFTLYLLCALCVLPLWPLCETSSSIPALHLDTHCSAYLRSFYLDVYPRPDKSRLYNLLTFIFYLLPLPFVLSQNNYVVEEFPPLNFQQHTAGHNIYFEVHNRIS